MLFSPHEPRNISERFVALIPKVCTRAILELLELTYCLLSPIAVGAAGAHAKVTHDASRNASPTKITAPTNKIHVI